MTDVNGAQFTGFNAVFQALVIIIVLTAGTAVIMWLGEQITISGIGNGISIILLQVSYLVSQHLSSSSSSILIPADLFIKYLFL